VRSLDAVTLTLQALPSSWQTCLQPLLFPGKNLEPWSCRARLASHKSKAV
jgi:hypothetical protein